MWNLSFRKANRKVDLKYDEKDGICKWITNKTEDNVEKYMKRWLQSREIYKMEIKFTKKLEKVTSCSC